jgi:CBS domain-containing protein
LRKEQKFLPSGIKNIFLAREIMKHNPITVTREADLTEAAQIMTVWDQRADIRDVISIGKF